MNRDDIIRMAREAGFDLEMWQLSLGSNVWGTHEELEHFAALVAADEREAKDELLAALQDLLMDTQHAEHQCGDKNCPVAHAKSVALKYDTILAKGKA